MIPEKYNNLPDRFKLLFTWGDPTKAEIPYSYRRWENYLDYGFTEADMPILLELVDDVDIVQIDQSHKESWAQLYAGRVLAQLKSPKTIDLFISYLNQYEFDDFISGEATVALAMIGKPAMPRLLAFFFDEHGIQGFRVDAASALCEMTQQHPELRDEIIEHLRTYLKSPELEKHEFNGLLVSSLMGMKAVELIDEIRDLFANDAVNITIPGDLEDVEIFLNLRKERSTPRPDYGKLSQEMTQDEVDQANSLEEDDTFNPFSTSQWADLPEPDQPYIRDVAKIGRNDPCPCGSGKKFKRCCL